MRRRRAVGDNQRLEAGVMMLLKRLFYVQYQSRRRSLHRVKAAMELERNFFLVKDRCWDEDDRGF